MKKMFNIAIIVFIAVFAFAGCSTMKNASAVKEVSVAQAAPAEVADSPAAPVVEVAAVAEPAAQEESLVEPVIDFTKPVKEVPENYLSEYSVTAFEADEYILKEAAKMKLSLNAKIFVYNLSDAVIYFDDAKMGLPVKYTLTEDKGLLDVIIQCVPEMPGTYFDIFEVIEKDGSYVAAADAYGYAVTITFAESTEK